MLRWPAPNCVLLCTPWPDPLATFRGTENPSVMIPKAPGRAGSLLRRFDLRQRSRKALGQTTCPFSGPLAPVAVAKATVRTAIIVGAEPPQSSCRRLLRPTAVPAPQAVLRGLQSFPTGRRRPRCRSRFAGGNSRPEAVSGRLWNPLRCGRRAAWSYLQLFGGGVRKGPYQSISPYVSRETMNPGTGDFASHCRAHRTDP